MNPHSVRVETKIKTPENEKRIESPFCLNETKNKNVKKQERDSIFFLFVTKQKIKTPKNKKEDFQSLLFLIKQDKTKQKSLPGVFYNNPSSTSIRSKPSYFHFSIFSL